MREKIPTSKRVSPASGLLIAVLLLIVMVWATPAPAQVLPRTNVPITGEIERIILNDIGDVYSGGKIVVGGVVVILPKNLLIDLPANRLSLQQIFKQAPAGCAAVGESGLAKADTCNASGVGGFATITAVRTTLGDVIAGDVFIEKGREAVTGTVTYINHTDGYFRINGITGDANAGVMVRLNDPDAVHSIQQGPGCAGGPNCSADPRFMLDGENYVIAFSTGYPVCIPSAIPRTVPAPGLPAIAGITAIPAGTTAQAAGDGSGDVLCPSTNRTPAALNEPPVADSRRFAPLVVGDSVTVEGNFETISGVRFVSTHTMRVNKALATRNSPDQPDYLFLEEVFIEAPGFQNQRMRAMWIGFTTLAPTDVDIWSIHRDPATNAVHEIPLASVLGCDNSAGIGTCSSQGLVNAGANIFRIRYDVDFLLAASGFPSGTKDAKLSPCDHLRANPRWTGLNLCGGPATLANNFAVLSPVPHEIQARTGHLIQNPGLANVSVDVRGNPATNGQYLFPLGMNLGGIEVAEMTEIDLNLIATPTIFEGLPWNLDRRLGPSGCLDNAGIPTACPAGPPIPLDPFPYTGLDPREQSNFLVGGLPGGLPTGSFSTLSFTQSILSNVRNRIFSYVDATGKPNGNFTILPYLLGTFPADPPLQPAGAPILPLTLACSPGGFGPVANDDTVTIGANTPITITVLANDKAVVGSINFASIVIASPVSHGTTTVNLDGTVTYTPAAGFSGTDSFTYTVAETTTGAISNIATVTITVVGPPTAVNDTAMTNKNVPIVIPVLINDSTLFGTLDVTSIQIASGPSGTSTAVANANGTVTYTPSTGFFGADSFTYTVANTLGNRSAAASVSVVVNDVSTPPLALNDTASTTVEQPVTINVLANDLAFGATIDPATVSVIGLTPAGSGGTSVNTTTGEVTFTPATGFSALAAFTYTVKDNLNRTSNAATVFIAVNGRPTANSQAVSAVEDTALPITLTGSDLEGSPLTYAILSGPATGTLSGAAPNVVYTPNPNSNAADSFTFNVTDNALLTSATATVTINIIPVNDPSLAGAQTVTTPEDTPLLIALIGIDPDPLDTLTYTMVTQPLHGTVTTGTAASRIYTPALNYNGPDTFSYVVSDGTVTSVPASVTLSVTPVNDLPLAGNDAVSTAINTTAIISVLANDTDIDGTINVASVTIGTAPVNGTATPNANGTVTYAPNAGFTGINTFTYTVNDSLGATSLPATVTVTVAGSTENVALALAQFRFVTPNVNGDWRIEGTATPNTTLTIHVGNDLTGAIIVSNLPVDAAGKWKFQAAGSTVLPDPTNTISVITGGGAVRLAFPVAVR